MKKKGREIVLCSGASKEIVEIIFNEYKFFSEWYSSTSFCNLTGENKAKFLVSKYGFNGFDYAGNSLDDIYVWKAARHCIIVNSNHSVKIKLKILSINIYKEF